MNSNLDVWAIQSNPEELRIALDNLKSDNDILLYTNLLCSFKIGEDNIIPRQFDTILYSEENDLLVILMRDGKVSLDDIKDYLDIKKMKYNEVNFSPSIANYEEQYLMPELWFAREKSVVDDAFADSIKINETTICEYYPFLTGELEFDYLTNDCARKSKIDGRLFKGVIKLNDKLIFLINSIDYQNVTPSEVQAISKKYKVVCQTLENNDFNMHDYQSPFSKKLEKK